MDQATFDAPSGVAADAIETYVADRGNHSVRLIAENKVTTAAGTGASGLDNGSADQATFTLVGGVALDGKRVYMADTGNHAIRLLEAGQVSTVAGGKQGFADGDLQTALFNQPSALAVHDGRIYVADRHNHRIRVIDLTAAAVTTLAGAEAGFVDGPAATARFKEPGGVTVDAQGRVYVADGGNNRIRLIDGGNVSTVAGSDQPGLGDGPSEESQLHNPQGVAVDTNGRVFIADTDNMRIRVLDGDRVETVAGTVSGFADGPSDGAKLNLPWDVAVVGKRVVVVEQLGQRVRQIAW